MHHLCIHREFLELLLSLGYLPFLLLLTFGLGCTVGFRFIVEGRGYRPALSFILSGNLEFREIIPYGRL